MTSSTNRALKDAFSTYRSDPRRRFHVKIRRLRARQIRELLFEPDAVDLETFNSDVWVLYSGIYLNGEAISSAAFDNADAEHLARYESALHTGELELHGNSIWRPPTQIYGAMLGVGDEQKVENVREALHFLNDAELTPPQKARRVQSVPGFGPANATGLVTIFHPDEFAIYNKQSRGALKKLGRDESTVEAFEQEAASLKELLGAEDYLELDHFLLHINQGWIEVTREEVITAQRYAEAFRALEPLSDNYLKMLQAHYAAPARTITATRLARAVGYPNYNSANLTYPKLGGRLGKHVGWLPGMPLEVLVTFEHREGEWHWIMRPQVAQALEILGWAANKGEDEDDNMHPSDRGPLNCILYGPPGTGKTYSVQREAIRILEPDSSDLPDEEIIRLYRDHRSQGRIEFVTFHPSYSYEEFVEGFRYDEEAKIPTLHDGIFKQMVGRALSPRKSPTPAEGAKIWKVSLGGSDSPQVFQRCIDEEEIAIGWLEDHDLEGQDKEGIAKLFVEEYGDATATNSINSVNNLVGEMRDGDYVAVLKNQREIRAIGTVTGAYRDRGEDYGQDYPHTRPVEWLDQRDHDIYEMNGGVNLTLSTIYRLKWVSLQDFVMLLPEEERTDDPHVLVIDEINRANISRVFGELITLLEEDKRLGQPNEMSVRLPYSKDAFGVPPNLYVIGTMNTADRSIALLDVALRRRFAFKEMMPDVEVVRRHLLGAIEVDPDTDFGEDEVQLVCEVFEELNRRIGVLVDRDHQVGHSYFMEATSANRLHAVLYRKLFPLLQEYFYNDQRRLKLLLGVCNPDAPKGFVHSLESEYRSVYGEDPLDDEAPWQFHEYPDDQLIEVLRNTFLTAG